VFVLSLRSHGTDERSSLAAVGAGGDISDISNSPALLSLQELLKDGTLTAAQSAFTVTSLIPKG
jgi:hypothetical protein